MAQPKGSTGNPNGRPKGSENKTTAISKQVINDIIEYFSPTIINDLENMEAVDRMNALIKLLPYVIPKQSVMGIGIDDDMKDKVSSLMPFK